MVGTAARLALTEIPLHRRFRFWLPFLVVFPALLFSSSETWSIANDFRSPAWGTNPAWGFLVSQFHSLLEPLITTANRELMASLFLPFFFWYPVGWALDRARADKSAAGVWARGWAWVLVAFAVIDLSQLATTALPPLIAYGPLFQDHNAVLRERIGEVLATAAYALPGPVVWLLVLRELRRGMRTSAPQAQTPTLAWVQSGALAIVFLAMISLTVVTLFGPRLVTTALTLLLASGCVTWVVPQTTLGRLIDSARRQLHWQRSWRHLLLAGTAVMTWLGLEAWHWYTSRTYYSWSVDYSFVAGLRKFLAYELDNQLATFILIHRWNALLLPLLLLIAARVVYRRMWASVGAYAISAVLGISMWLTLANAGAIGSLITRTDRALAIAIAVVAFSSVLAPALLGRTDWQSVYSRAIAIAAAFAWLDRDIMPIAPFAPFLMLALVFITRFSALFPLNFPRLRLIYLVRSRRWLIRRSRVQYAALAAFAWLLVSIAVQSQAVFWSALGFVSLVVLLRLAIPNDSQYRWILYGGALAWLGIRIAGSYNPERDLFLAFIAAAVCYGGWEFCQRRRWQPSQVTAAFILFLVTWGFCSAGDALPSRASLAFSRRSGPTYAPGRFAKLQGHNSLRVGLALSGGGYRAAIMHAGVLEALEQLGIPVTHMSAVSGGSITAAYYALGGDPRAFRSFVTRGDFNTRRDVLDVQNAGRMLLSAPFPGTHVRLVPHYLFSRTDVQAGALDRVLLRGTTLGELPQDAPKLMLCSTDLNSGSAVGLTPSWTITRFLMAPPGEDLFVNARTLYGRQPRLTEPSSFERLDSRRTRLSTAVAASGAVPLVFEPVPLRNQSGNEYLMSDGGVSDNSGVTLLLEADRRSGLPLLEDGTPQGDKDWALDVAIAVDGGAMFQRNPRSSGSDLTALESAGRAVDIVYSRLGATRPAESRSRDGKDEPVKLLLSPSLYMDNSRRVDYSRIAIKDSSNKLDNDFEGALVGMGAFTPEQQQLFRLVAVQVANMDLQSLEIMTENWESLPSQWLSEQELQVLAANAAGEPADAAVVKAINQKRSIRTQILKGLSVRIAHQLSHSLATFVGIPTLQDQIDKDDADAINDLGRYLALLNVSEIRPILGGRATDRSMRVTAAEAADVTCAIAAVTHYSVEVGERDTHLPEAQHRAAQAAFESCLAEQSRTDALLRADLKDGSVHTLSMFDTASR
jgi:predicted acylesterase/phospholipase RssA